MSGRGLIIVLPRHFMEGLSNKTMQKPQDSWCPGRDSNTVPSEYVKKSYHYKELLAYVINIGIYCIRHYDYLNGAECLES